MNKEIRTFNNIEFRATEENDKNYISGYALKFDVLSKDLGGFYETINREAINDETDLTDVVALFNHNPLYVLARKNEDVNTLELTVDDTGLFYRFEVDNDISYIRDLYLNIKKGNINKSSFAFKVSDGGDSWFKSESKLIRSIKSFKGIYDVSPVTNPAYTDTKVDIRNIKGVTDLTNESKFNYEYLVRYYYFKNSLI